MTKYRIATIAGDGIGKEVVPEAIRVLETASSKFCIDFEWDHVDWSCEYYAKHRRMMLEDGLEQIRGHDAITSPCGLAAADPCGQSTSSSARSQESSTATTR